MRPFDYFDEMGACKSFFLLEYSEPATNSLRILVVEAKVSPQAVPINFGGRSMGEGFPVRIEPDSAKFELVWDLYILYQIVNESYGGSPEDSKEGVVSNLVRVYKSSNLLRYVKSSIVASDEYPGKAVHYEIVCEQHVVDVICHVRPKCRRIGPALQIN
jgi:hypothetical protein